MQSYEEFLESKVKVVPNAGFEPSGLGVLPLFDFQRAIVEWATRKGRAAIFADTGLGKTRMQLAWADQVARRTGQSALILTPLAVGPQTLKEARVMGIGAAIVEAADEVQPGINITNYDRLHKFDTSVFAGVVLDESSILKSFMGATKRRLVEAFAETPYKLACTATPAPNDYEELGNHSEFLGVMPRMEMLTRWFIHDSANTAEWRLKEHGRAEFWSWVASWAVCISSPADIGFDGARYVLPPLHIHEQIVSTEGLPPIEGQLFRDSALSATTIHKEMRLTAQRRAERVVEIALESDEPALIWVNTDYEADAVTSLLLDAREVRGSDTDASKVDGLMGFVDGRYKVLVTKPSIAGFGMNWQHCRRVIFMGLSYSYEQFYQAVRRCWRFGQTRPVDAYIVIADSEGGILRTIQDKEKEHQRMKAEMQIAMDEVMTLGAGHKALLALPEAREAVGDGWRLVNDDCVQALSREPDNSIGFSVFSPPFSTLYIYSDSIADMGNTADDTEFFRQFGYVVDQLERVMMPGRLVAIHCTDLPLFKWKDGRTGRKDFPGAIVRAMEAHGVFTFHSRVMIWKDPVVEMQRTKAHGLLYKELCKNSCHSRQGIADQVLVFGKMGESDPVNSGAPERFYDYVGTSKVAPSEYLKGRTAEEVKRLYSIAVWQRYASPVWFDINQTDVLNKELARAESDERHICPLQLDVIERCIELWSNPGDLIMSPFAGIGSEGYQAIKQGRKFLGIELKPSYFDIAARHLRMAEMSKSQPSLFDEVPA
ncbi:HELICc domain containing protein [uncultured Caudovirales phage]|uniref:HELICc domain containing protein n=1 Tax=uncultured Caudovirales phage TaxID=2100421 RepID=A0A6J5QJW6_9CAUD|nr:HELICc domain containing protein [uncultured Caudovirales phage]